MLMWAYSKLRGDDNTYELTREDVITMYTAEAYWCSLFANLFSMTKGFMGDNSEGWLNESVLKNSVIPAAVVLLYKLTCHIEEISQYNDEEFAGYVRNYLAQNHGIGGDELSGFVLRFSYSTIALGRFYYNSLYTIATKLGVIESVENLDVRER